MSFRLMHARESVKGRGNQVLSANFARSAATSDGDVAKIRSFFIGNLTPVSLATLIEPYHTVRRTIPLSFCRLCQSTRRDIQNYKGRPSWPPFTSMLLCFYLCPREDSNLEPTDYAYRYGFRRAPPCLRRKRSLWSGLSLRLKRLPSSLYTFPV
jgi:hypothetical protein